jgi:beta-lactamase regulating signal transducer with metallopeptidase domain
MNSIESAAVDLLGRGWLLVLVFTASVLIVMAMRKPCRRLFGAERTFHLWLLPPLALLASQLPHASATPVVIWSPVVSAITSATIVSSVHDTASSVIGWHGWIVSLWLLGSVASLLLAGFAQARYRARLYGANTRIDARSGRTILHALGTDVGPALVGVWRSCIVLPADFESRYDAIEQQLILAHETIHARRHDGWWSLLAQIAAAMLWFHPLAWWALAALRHDQELACDAAVLREHGAQRRSYANAMLKTQSAAFVLPVGCPWSPRHPITERIAMLKLPQPDLLHRRVGGALVAVLAIGVTGAAYAATPAPPAKAGKIMVDRYTLKVDVDHPGSMEFTRCLKPNEFTDVYGMNSAAMSWKGRFAVTPVANGQLEIRGLLDTRFDNGDGKVRTQSGKPIVRTMPGQQATLVFGQAVDGRHLAGAKLQDNTLKIVLTPSLGCSDEMLSSAWHPVQVSQQAKSRSARSVAEAVAAKAGFVLVNPEALGNAPVSLNFEQMPATSALQLIADIDGKRAVFDDKRVHFESK